MLGEVARNVLLSDLADRCLPQQGRSGGEESLALLEQCCVPLKLLVEALKACLDLRENTTRSLPETTTRTIRHDHASKIKDHRTRRIIHT
jgi:hypothetical protein